jgi:DNA-binding SARP family transcriptional activator/Tfp pilus assembly protein PilF
VLTLFLLGDLRLERDGARVLAGRRKPLALLTFLVRRGSRRSSREELASLFWGNGDDASARKSLRQCLTELRAVDGLAFVESEAGVALAPGSLSTDVEQFEADVRAGEWQRAVQRWTGAFVAAGESLGDAAWQHWLDGERTALRRQLALACDHLTTAAERSGEWGRMIESAATWRALLPSDNRAWFREIQALQAAGRVSDAVARASEGEQYFRNELGTAVPEDLARLSRLLARVQHVAGTPAASLLTPDLVGRSGAMDVLTRARVAVQLERSGRTVLIVAPEGLGKTRLLREFARRASETSVIEVSANAADRARRLSFVQAIISQIATHDALAGCAPEMLATLAEIAPEIGRHFRHLPSASSQGDRLTAMRSALEEVAHDSTINLVLDDLPDADDESQAVMASILRSPLPGILVVAAGRPESWQASTSLSTLATRLDHGEVCPLEPLSADEVRRVLSSMAPLVPATLDELVPALHRVSGGNPGILALATTHLAMSKALRADDNGTWSCAPGALAATGTPPSVEERWRARYMSLGTDVQHVVDAAAILGSATADRATTVSALEELSGIEADRFRAALEQLRLSGILRLHGARVAFAAEYHAQLAYDAQAPSRRNVLHERAARLHRRNTDAASGEAATIHQQRSGRRPWNRRLAAGLVGVAVLGAAAWYGARGSAARVPPRTPVLLADVLNLTGDSAFDQALYIAASVGLQQSRQVSLFPRSRVRETLSRMRKPGADSTLDEALAREIAVRENLARVVLLSVARLDREYLVGGRIIDPSSGADLYAHQERAGGPNEVLDALGEVLSRIRRAAGESTDSIRTFSAPLPRVTTASLPALQAYATALRAFTARRYPEAQALYRRAVELDPTFAMAWLGMAEARWSTANDRQRAFDALAQAERHSDRLTERERLRLAQVSAGYRGNAAEELRIAETLANSHPEVTTWYNYGSQLMRRRRCPEALTAFEKALGFDSSYANAHINTATCHQFLGAFDAAVASYNRAWAVDSQSVYQGALNHEFGIALARAGDPDSALAVFRRMARRPANQDQQYGQRSLAYHASWSGHWRAAAIHFDSATMLTREARLFPLSEFRNHILLSDLLLTAQQHSRAGQSLDSAWALRQRVSLAPYFAMIAGIAYVRAGQLDRAAEMLRNVNASLRESSSDDRTVRAILSARMALAQRRVRDARRDLEAATDTTRRGHLLAVLVDVLVALGHRDSALVAATEFEQRGDFGTDTQDAWMRNLLTKARLAEQLGQTVIATDAYTRLATQLRSGDADHPLLVESQRGLARLALNDSRRTP